MTADREDGEIQLEDEGSENGEEEEELENEEVSLFDESKCYLIVCLRRIASYLHKIRLNARRRIVLGNFSVKGVACFFQSGWRVTSCHT